MIVDLKNMETLVMIHVKIVIPTVLLALGDLLLNVIVVKVVII